MIEKTWSQEANAPLIYVIFLSGAADKESFLWGNINLPFVDSWPHKTMYHIAKQFNYDLLRQLKTRRTITKKLISCYYRFAYLSYAEVCFCDARDYDPRVKISHSLKHQHLNQYCNRLMTKRVFI